MKRYFRPACICLARTLATCPAFVLAAMHDVHRHPRLYSLRVPWAVGPLGFGVGLNFCLLIARFIAKFYRVAFNVWIALRPWVDSRKVFHRGGCSVLPSYSNGLLGFGILGLFPCGYQVHGISLHPPALRGAGDFPYIRHRRY